jgi:hypothetical protein
MSLYIFHIKKITKLLPNIYLLYISPSKSITKLINTSHISSSDDYTIKVYIPDSIKINYSIHDFNHQYDLNMMKEGMYSINMIYSDKYLNYNISSIKLINFLKVIHTDEKSNSKLKFKSKKENIINNIIDMTTVAYSKL